jgi:hypothetical protein
MMSIIQISMKPEYFIAVLICIGWLIFVHSLSLVYEAGGGPHGVVHDPDAILNRVTKANLKAGTNVTGGQKAIRTYLLESIQAGTNAQCGDYYVSVGKRFGDFLGDVRVVSKYGGETITADKGTLSRRPSSSSIELQLQNATLQQWTNTYQMEQYSVILF